MVRVADASISLSLSAHPISVSTSEVHITVPEQMITLPHAHFTFGVFLICFLISLSRIASHWMVWPLLWNMILMAGIQANPLRP